MSTISEDLLTDQKKCSCKGSNLDKLLQPQILTLLAEKPYHGYVLIQELENKMTPGCGKLDPTGIYRTLKNLEDKNLIASEWDVEGTGAAKRIYRINACGKACLQTWINTLEDYQQTIASIIDDAKNILNRSTQ